MIAVRLNSLLPRLDDLCQCIKEYASNADSIPCDAVAFNFTGSIIQTAVCFSAASALQVPRGQIATVNKVVFTERYPGTLYGANFFLIVNDNMVQDFPRLDHSLGSFSSPAGWRICLQEQDILSVMLQCSWTPGVATAITSTYTQMMYPFQISGFYEDRWVQ